MNYYDVRVLADSNGRTIEAKQEIDGTTGWPLQTPPLFFANAHTDIVTNGPVIPIRVAIPLQAKTPAEAFDVFDATVQADGPALMQEEANRVIAQLQEEERQRRAAAAARITVPSASVLGKR